MEPDSKPSLPAAVVNEIAEERATVSVPATSDDHAAVAESVPTTSPEASGATGIVKIATNVLGSVQRPRIKLSGRTRIAMATRARP